MAPHACGEFREQQKDEIYKPRIDAVAIFCATADQVSVVAQCTTAHKKLGEMILESSCSPNFDFILFSN